MLFQKMEAEKNAAKHLRKTKCVWKEFPLKRVPFKKNIPEDWLRSLGGEIAPSPSWIKKKIHCWASKVRGENHSGKVYI